MNKEIERKFLVNKEKWSKLNKPKAENIRQGYLLNDYEKTIRIRIKDNKAFLTLKSSREGDSRSEYEYEIPENDANELMKKFTSKVIVKKRYKINYDGKIWEVDEFLEENSGLLMAEIELENEYEKFEKPEWIEKEVTQDEKYYNSNLINEPYKEWRD